MDIFGLHGTDPKAFCGQVTSLTLPHNCTALHHPMYMDTIGSRESRYRSFLIRSIVKDLETRQHGRDDSAALKQRMRGLVENLVPHLLEIAKMFEMSCPSITDMTICIWLWSEVKSIADFSDS